MELFEGKVSLHELVEMDIPMIYDLRDAKIRLIEEKQKLQKKMEEQAKSQAGRKKPPRKPPLAHR